MNLGKKLKDRRLELEMTLEEVGEITRVSKSTVMKWENGDIENMKRDKIALLAKALQVSPLWIMGIEEENNVISLPSVTVSYIPNAVAAGVPETIEGYQDLPKIQVPELFLGKYANRKDLLMMKVNGESMNKIIRSGSYIAVITDIEVNNLKEGDLVVFNHEYQYSLKHYHDIGDKIVFKPNSTNIAFTDLVIDKDEDLKIVGKVIMYNVNLD